MPSREGRFEFTYDVNARKKLVEIYGTTDKSEIKNKIRERSLMTNQELLESLGVAPQQQLTTKEKLEKVKLANETLKIWKEFNHAGFSLDQLEDYVNNGIMPYMENPVFPEKKKEESKPQLTFGKTITHKPRQIKQDDGTLRCKI